MAPDRGSPAARTPFATLMALESTQKDEYKSLTKGFAPGGTRIYGGHVVAQAAWAAAQTVREGFVIHNIHCSFILPGAAKLPFVYTVSRIRDGGRYSTRSVIARQPDDTGSVEKSGICFTCTCSFKTDEEGGFEHQAEIGTVEERYREVLQGKRPEDWAGAPRVDVPWFWEYASEHNLRDTTPGVDVRKVDMGAFNISVQPEKYRQLQYYSTIGDMPKDLNLHACAHLYASDRNSLFLVANAHGIGNRFTGIGSVSHAVVFHVPSEDLRFVAGDEEGEEQTWFCQEAWGGCFGLGTRFACLENLE